MGSICCVGTQAVALLCCIANVWSTSAAGQRVGQGPVEQVSCRAYGIWQACTLGLPGKSYVCRCYWESAGLFPFYRSVWGCRVPDARGPSSMTRGPGHSSCYASTAYFVRKSFAPNVIYRNILIMCVQFLNKL